MTGVQTCALPILPERDEPYYHAFFEPSYPDGDWLTEDFTFCRKAQQAGFGVWLWPYAKVNHMGAHVFTGDENVVRAMCWGVKDERDTSEDDE